jgi:hypothetical protein
MKNLKFALVFIILFASISFSFGWGAVGHKIVADVAKSYVGKDIQDSVNKYLGDMTWESASTWMDEMRSNHQYDYFKAWHYLDLEKGDKYDDTLAKGNNIIVQLKKAINNLTNRKNLSKDDIHFNLLVLIHLMGDFHMPLHVGYGVDKGGNTIKVTFNGKATNLHHIWDSDIIEYKKITYDVIESLLTKETKQQLKEITDGDIISWFNQTRKYLDTVYSYTDTISEDYINKCYPIIESQLLYAGVRLGFELNNIFKK